MEDQFYAIQYFQLKEQALIQRHHIDYEMAENLDKLKEDQSSTGKASKEDYQQKIEETEDTFNQTISSIQPIFEKLFQQLKNFGATREQPYSAKLNDFLIHFYIDENKNIHYKKTE